MTHILPDDVLNKIFSHSLGSNNLLYLYYSNKKWNNLIKEFLLHKHYKKIYLNTKRDMSELNIENFLLEKENIQLITLYETLVTTIEQFMIY